MKTLTTLSLITTLSLGLIACGGGGGSEDVPVQNTTPIEQPKFTLTSNVMSNSSSLPLEHYCKDAGGQNLSPNLSWANAPKGTGGFVVFAIVPNREKVEDPNGLGYNESTILSTSILPVTYTYMSTGEDITKTIPGSYYGVNTNTNTRGWGAPCRKVFFPGDSITFKVFAVKPEMLSIDITKFNYFSDSSWNPARMYYKYGEYVLGEASFTVSLDKML